jgi:hypothetical protein
MLTGSTVLLVRHAEKPDKGRGLSPMGQARADGYASYFPNLPVAGQRYAHLFAAADSINSQRPSLTLTPLAHELKMHVETPYTDDQYVEFATTLLGTGDYTNQNIVVCWHHGEILDLAGLLLRGYTPPPQANWPQKPWPGDVFGWLLWISYDNDENPTSQTCCYR